MELEYVVQTGAFVLSVPRADSLLVGSLVQEHGWNFSQSASTIDKAKLFTKEPYAAAEFAGCAVNGAAERLQPIISAIAASRKENSDVSIPVPADLELWPFQRASVEYALQRPRCLVGDQPGLGKTPIAICLANAIRAARILVVCPANIRLQWAARIREWSVLPKPYVVYTVLSGKNGVHPNAEWTIVSYDLARTEAIGKVLARGRYDLLILDEAHYLKSADADRTQAIFGDHSGTFRKLVRTSGQHEYDEWFPALASRCGAVLALTGTPLPNRPREAYVLARHLCWDSIDWMSEEHFRERFNPSARIEGVRKDGTRYIYNREEVGRCAELQNRLRANFMVRHLKRDVMPQLQWPAYDLVRVLSTGPVKAALKAESLLGINPDLLTTDTETLGNWAVARHNMGLAIAPQVVEYARMCLDGGEDKLVIGAWHKDVLDEYEKGLHRYGVLRIDGSVSPGQKQNRVEQFQQNPDLRVMIGNVISLGTGTDGLQHASSHVLIGEPDPVPGNNEQFVDRLDRGGQKRTVQADIFVAPNSLLETILSHTLTKRLHTHAVLDLINRRR